MSSLFLMAHYKRHIRFLVSSIFISEKLTYQMHSHSEAYSQGIPSDRVALRVKVIEDLIAVKVKLYNKILRITFNLSLALNFFGLGLVA